jgi:chromosome segregation ATPase
VARQAECEKIVKDAQDKIDMLRDLINQGREKASLEATVNKLEKDLSYAIMALDEAKVQGSQESEERMAITRSSERNMRKLNEELEGLRRKNKALQRASEDYENRLKYETEQREKASNDLRKLQRRYDELRDEKSVIDPVHSQLKTKLEEATFRAETLENSLDMLSKERDDRLKRADGTISHLESELSKVKSSWMHDVEMMSQIRHERDSLQTNFSLLEQKWKKMCDENSKLKDKVEELKIEARTNLEASRHNPTPDRTIRTATGSLPRFEMEYQRQLEGMQKNYEQEIEKLIEASDYLREKLESERQWSQNLQEANKKLNEQLEVYLKKTDSV